MSTVLSSNIISWKNNDFVNYCSHENKKYFTLCQFIQDNSIDGTFFFTVTREDFENIQDLSPEGVELFFELQQELKSKIQEDQEIMGPPQEQQIIEAHEDILKSMPLILRDNHNKEFIFDEKEVRLGRDQNSCHIFYEDKSISRNHASIWRIGPSYFIRDESSSNGTFVKLICGNHYQIVQNMHLEIPKVAEISIINVGLLQVKIKVNVEFEEESQKEFNVNLWGQQTWVIGSLQNQLVCEIADNAQTLDLQFCEIKQLGIKNVVKILKPEGVWNKIGSKDLRDIFKYYPIKKGDVLRVGDNIQLTVKNENEFEDFVGDVCLLCKFKYPESVEFVNLDCKHCWACRVCRNTDILCPVCSEQIKNWEAVSNVVSFDEN